MLVHQNWSTKKKYEGLVGFASIGNTYRIDDYLRVHAAGVTLRSLKEKIHYITNTLQMDVVKDQDGDLVVEASLLPKLAKSKYKRGSQEVVTKVTSDMLDDGQEANDFAQLQDRCLKNTVFHVVS